MMPGAALLIALLSQAAGAARVTTLRLDVHAPADCTSRGDLAARIGARSPRVQLAADAPVAARVTVTSPRPGSVIADVVLANDGVGQSPRRVAARSCAEAADAVALIIAVTLDPSSIQSASPLPIATQNPAVQATAPGRGPIAPAPTRGREYNVTVAGQTVAGAAPGVLPGLAVYGMIALDRPGLWAPALFVGATHVWRSDLAEAGGAASFTFDAISVDACPLVLQRSLLSARPCASGVVGRVATEGSNTRNPGSARRPFGAAGAALVVTAGARWQLSARLGVGVTLLRDSYEFAADAFYRAAALTFSASLGVGVGWR